MGQSLFYNESVAYLIAERIPNTMLLVLSAMLIVVVFGTLLGVLSAYKPKGILSFGVTIFSLVGFAVPVFWSGTVLLIVFAYWFPIFPPRACTTSVNILPAGTLSGRSGITSFCRLSHHPINQIEELLPWRLGLQNESLPKAA
ncbi:hypothetical protein [Allopusillimonas ginsengisoli]|uniref:hypothetical protein n=1 Tax=Allopusillimonas ginsengisoli TaxID=453575 RepID=UPI001020DB89|nr:hypothetical protein [Allopusillimonas ginsengisoli]TEA76923.1 hypothetical protein ERE07_17955 [Allopusillimonas ginsengisoli]